ncbi:hypothetical protein ACI76O_11750 [Capnocytophaga cynodegmi]|uniref:hypothetical protein n=1 Tax=Capnocytophaga cynodegmi TaxID=28189 RepID=UPI001BB4529E|nr:hypothetical protein [Capnocytophaga cynodegmi]
MGNFSYVLFVKTDSVNISKTPLENNIISGVYDKNNGIVLLLSMAESRNTVVKQNLPLYELPHVIYKCNPEKETYEFGFSNDKLGLSNQMISRDLRHPLGQYLLQQMDTMQNPIKF